MYRYVSQLGPRVANKDQSIPARKVVGEAWGLPDPAFGHDYTVGALAAIAFSCLALFLVRHYRSAQPSRTPGGELAPTEIALICGRRGGTLHAYRVAAFALHERGLLDADGMVRPHSDPIRMLDLDPLAAMVLRGLAGKPSEPFSMIKIKRVRATRDHLQRMREQLERYGLLHRPIRGRPLGLICLPLLAALTLGATRLILGVRSDKPVGGLAMLIFAQLAGLAWLCTVARMAGQVTAAGRAELTRLRSQFPHYAPDRVPSWPGYGTGGAALAAAIFGVGIISMADARFAQSVGIGESGSRCPTRELGR